MGRPAVAPPVCRTAEAAASPFALVAPMPGPLRLSRARVQGLRWFLGERRPRPAAARRPTPPAGEHSGRGGPGGRVRVHRLALAARPLQHLGGHPRAGPRGRTAAVVQRVAAGVGPGVGPHADDRRGRPLRHALVLRQRRGGRLRGAPRGRVRRPALPPRHRRGPRPLLRADAAVPPRGRGAHADGPADRGAHACTACARHAARDGGRRAARGVVRPDRRRRRGAHGGAPPAAPGPRGHRHDHGRGGRGRLRLRLVPLPPRGLPGGDGGRGAGRRGSTSCRPRPTGSRAAPRRWRR